MATQKSVICVNSHVNSSILSYPILSQKSMRTLLSVLTLAHGVHSTRKHSSARQARHHTLPPKSKGGMCRLLPQRVFPAIPSAAVWSAVLGYVVLGPLDWRTHKWLYTGDPHASVWDNLRRGQIATFGKVYTPGFRRASRSESGGLCGPPGRGPRGPWAVAQAGIVVSMMYAAKRIDRELALERRVNTK